MAEGSGKQFQWQKQILTATAAKSLQSYPTLCDPIDGSPPGSPVPGLLQARTLEWVPFPSPMHENPWTAAYQAPPSVGFSRQIQTSVSYFLCICSLQLGFSWKVKYYDSVSELLLLLFVAFFSFVVFCLILAVAVIDTS